MTEAEAGPAGARPPRGADRRVQAAPRRRWPFRLRLLAALVGLAVLGIAASSVVTYLTDRQRAAERNDTALTRAVESFRLHAGDIPVRGEDPPSFASLSELVTSAVNRSVNTTGECTVGLVGDDLPVHDGSTALCDRVLGDGAFVRAVRATDPAAPITIRRLDADTGRYAFVAVPVTQLGDDRQGLYVDVVDEGTQLDEIRDSYLRTSLPLAGLTALLVVGVGWLLSGQIVRPLRNLVAATAALDADSTARVPVEGADEVGELARAMNGAMDRIDAAFASQRQLLDDVGHELRTPLQVIRGNLELADPEDPDDVRTAHAVALDEIDRMTQLTQSLVTLAQADAPGFVDLRPVGLGPLVEDVVDKARMLGPREWRVDSTHDATVMTDPARLTQALLELANNAVKYSAEGTRITTSVGRDAAEATITVSDQGRGIPADELGSIFERFTRVARGGSGAGLGLAIVEKIVAAHHGRIVVTSDVGQGSSFTIWLPLATAGHQDGRP